ncbi:BTAD domain-containing putative transcriptional regulator [Sphaerimonospora cavernae]|uniref:BTAD domain-containing putative transcriptional regulator n=1 Tax=Sphaerimonospora cavernae TaxID=1740611 RepID=A0ABV6TYQ8_9ACTN
MRFGILGPVEARPDDAASDAAPVAVGGPKVRALLTVLLLAGGRVVTTEQLIDGLYGAEPPAGAVNALQAQVSRLRRVLGELVVRHPAGYLLAVEPDDVDALRFEHLAAEGRRVLSAGDHAGAVECLRRALGLWRGPALACVADAPFATAQAARLEELRLSAAEDLAEARIALGEHYDLVAELWERVAAHPLRERSAGQLMRALYAAGRQADALTVFENARRRLAEELGTVPSPELADIHLAVLRSDPSLSPASERRRPPPARLTSLIGRAGELERIAALLGESRLVTLTGPGGSGKTRLVAEAAARHPGEVWFVELAPLTDGADVPHAVLGALGLRDGPLPAPGGLAPARYAIDHRAREPVARLVVALTGRPALLVLDNCEHVIEAAARLADRLLAACPTLRVLATGREALGITGERLLPVPPLELPPPGASPADPLAYPAVRLFAERAGAVRPGFRLDPEVTQDVLRICRALDGLPLAIELAAARARSLTTAEIAGRLDGVAQPAMFSLLSRGSRTAQPRHRTLRAVVEWSWDLLDEAERTMARRLTVFAGGATLEAAERVCGLPDTDGVLASLVEKSLVEASDGRYRMLGTIRAFCAERLTEAGEDEPMRRAHVAYFLDLAATAEPHLRRSEQLEWLDRLDSEHDNLHAALRRATEDGDIERALRLLSALTGFWVLRGRRGEAAALAGELLRRITPELSDGPPAELVAKFTEEFAVCVCVAAWNTSQGLPVEAALRVVDTLSAPPRQPFLLVLRAMLGGPPDRSERRQLGSRYDLLAHDPWMRALATFGQAYLLLFDGRLEEAERAISESLRGMRALGDRWATVMALSGLSDIAMWRGDHERVEELADEALTLAEQLGSTADVAETLCRRAAGRAQSGNTAGTRADYERAVELARRAGAPELAADALLGLGELARHDGDPGEGRRLCEAALAECTAEWFNAEDNRARTYLTLGWIAQMEGDEAEALAWHRRAIATGVGGVNLFTAARMAEGLSGVALLGRDAERATLLLGVGAALRGTPPVGDADVERVADGCRTALGEAAFERLYGQARDAALERTRAVTGTAASAEADALPPSVAGAVAENEPSPVLGLITSHLAAFDDD